ncbi:MAG: thermostable hemolysin [Alphaproteobacteria bacterium]|nr:thermostable hemolysin [Alphaproteobacteria bacterium]
MQTRISQYHANPSRHPAHDNLNVQHPSLLLAREGNDGYESLSRYIATVFRKTYGANVETTYPLLMGLADAKGDPIAALGIRRAVEGVPLYLERYLARSAEACLQEHTGWRIPRRALAEVGNLASSGTGNISYLLHSMTCLLALRGVSHIIFTGTAPLKRYLCNLGLTPRVIAEGYSEQQGYKETRWGAYFTTHPKVMAGDILRRFETSPPAPGVKTEAVSA